MNNPSLRFTSLSPTDWYETSLSNVVDVVGGGTPSTNQDNYWNGDVQWFTPSEISQKYVTESSRKITEEGVNNSSARYLPQGTILFTSRASLGLSAINASSKKVTTNQGFQSLIPKEGWLSEFVYYLVNNRKFIQEVGNRASGSTFKEISSNNLKSINLFVPSDKSEQQKIAAFFTALDEKISLTKRKKENLKKIKKSLLERIFSDDLTCSYVSLGDVSYLRGRIGYRGYTCDDITSKAEGVISLSPGNIGEGLVIVSDGTYITRDKYEESPEIKVMKGDILFTKTGSTIGKIGFVDCCVEATINPQLALITAKDIDPFYLYCYLQTRESRRYVSSIAVGGALPTLSQEQLKLMPVPIINHDEMVKVSTLLKNVDNLINFTEKKQRLLCKLKSGFMQQMFI